jgi:hypothetical protein
MVPKHNFIGPFKLFLFIGLIGGKFFRHNKGNGRLLNVTLPPLFT